MPSQNANTNAAGAVSYEEASRFLAQASFGGSIGDIEEVQRLGLEGWFLAQIEMPVQPLMPRFLEAPSQTRNYVHPLFWERALHAPDQLRQRVTYALNQIIVISVEDAVQWTDAFVAYLDTLQDQAFGNYAALLRAVTYSPAMGMYLSHLGNEKADPASGVAPDENYAREVMQLFTIGVSPLTPGGEEKPGETFGPADVEGLAAILTGLTWAGQDRFSDRRLRAGDPNRLKPMDAYPVAHESGPKSFLGYSVEGPNPIEAIDGALAHLIDHQNTAPFVSKRIIQRLVTSNPSPRYVERVANAFARGAHTLPSGRRVGAGARGDMTATLAAILFDTEARSSDRLEEPTFGRLREPTLRYAHFMRALRTPWTPSAEPNLRLPSAATSGQSQFGEQAWWAPSVFSAFGPDYQATGTKMADRGLVSPEMQAMNAATTVGYLQFMTGVARAEARRDTNYDLRPWERVADDPAKLVDLIERTFFHGAMTDAARHRYVEALSRVAIPEQSARRPRFIRRRVDLAVLMLATDPAFAVQR